MNQWLFLISLSRLFEGGLTMDGALDFAKEAGFGAVEPTNIGELAVPDTEKAKRFADRCSRLGLEIPCFSMPVRLETADYIQQTERIFAFIDMALVMGAKFFHHTIAPTLEHTAHEMPLYEQIKPQLIEAAGRIQRHAAKYGITCVYEDQGYVVNGIQNYGDFFLSLPEPNKGVVSDLGNILFVNERPEDFTAHFLNKIVHVHIKDYLKKAGSAQFPGKGWYLSKNGDFLRGTVIGHGSVDFIQIFKILIRSGYKGWYSIEFDGLEDPLLAAELGRENAQYYYEEAQRQIGAGPNKAINVV